MSTLTTKQVGVSGSSPTFGSSIASWKILWRKNGVYRNMARLLQWKKIL